MARNEVTDWMEIASATMSLAMESAGVVGLRVAKAVTGGSNAADEAYLMYTEKVTALAELQMGLLSGTWGKTSATVAKRTLRHYRGKVRANHHRLGRS